MAQRRHPHTTPARIRLATEEKITVAWAARHVVPICIDEGCSQQRRPARGRGQLDLAWGGGARWRLCDGPTRWRQDGLYADARLPVHGRRRGLVPHSRSGHRPVAGDLVVAAVAG